MKIKQKKYLLIILFAVLCITCFLLFIAIQKTAKAQSNSNVKILSEENYVCYDILPGSNGSCFQSNGISLLALDNEKVCLDNCKTHGPGRENGGTGLLDTGCRNYMSYNFNYGATDIPYWVNMDNLNEITNTAHRQKIIEDIRKQVEMWNQAYMYDGTGQIVNIYEYTSNSKPNSINGRQVIEVQQCDLTKEGWAGVFDKNNYTVELNYKGNICYNVDTIVHEFGHVLGLMDIDSANEVEYGTHKTLMGYSRDTTATTLNKAIKYQDVQGIAVTTGRHTCQESHFMRYVKVNNEYRHVCFYCDRIDSRTSIISGSKAIGSNVNCEHDYKAMVSCGGRRWDKCTKCYKVIEINELTGSGNKITFRDVGDGTRPSYVTADYGKPLPEWNVFAPKKEGFAFDGYYDSYGTKYYEMRVVDDKVTANMNMLDHAYIEKVFPVPGKTWDYKSDVTLYARWTLLECDFTYTNTCDGKKLSTSTVHLTSGKNTITPISISGYKFSHFVYYGKNFTGEIDLVLERSYSNIIAPKLGIIYAVYKEDHCLAAGSLITLADGSQVAVENLKGDEMLLVWNLYTGTYDFAPILFIDKDPLQFYKVINLSFSDGTTVKVISEHGFWDYDLNKYVYLDADAANYIGHWFNKGDIRVQLVGVEIKDEYTSAWSPVTYGHLCYFVDGMLSMPGGIGGLFNIFDVDAETMKYDEVTMQLDIELYGLFTYEEFIEYFYLPEEAFEAFNGQYLKVAIGKGLTTIEELASLYNRYSEFLV